MLGDEGWLTVEELMDVIGAKENAIREALRELDPKPQSRPDIRNRRRLVYEPGTDKRVKEWLRTH